ncbi:MAG: DUF1801 domain-containing protein [Myxococcota bacterium]|nr:DUF1801 domain-containing protein [Myxococcota bacterium]
MITEAVEAYMRHAIEQGTANTETSPTEVGCGEFFFEGDSDNPPFDERVPDATDDERERWFGHLSDALRAYTARLTPVPTTVDAYLAAQPALVRKVLTRVRAAIRAAVPQADELISYRMPTYRLGVLPVLYFRWLEEPLLDLSGHRPRRDGVRTRARRVHRREGDDSFSARRPGARGADPAHRRGARRRNRRSTKAEAQAGSEAPRETLRREHRAPASASLRGLSQASSTWGGFDALPSLRHSTRHMLMLVGGMSTPVTMCSPGATPFDARMIGTRVLGQVVATRAASNPRRRCVIADNNLYNLCLTPFRL